MNLNEMVLKYMEDSVNRDGQQCWFKTVTLKTDEQIGTIRHYSEDVVYIGVDGHFELVRQWWQTYPSFSPRGIESVEISPSQAWRLVTDMEEGGKE